MSILIRGMEMPKNCTECRFAFDGRCLANWGRKSKIDVTNYCPLIELPAQHGRLIDSSSIGLTDFEIVMCDGDYKEALKMLLEKIERAPTVIEAEVSE